MAMRWGNTITRYVYVMPYRLAALLEEKDAKAGSDPATTTSPPLPVPTAHEAEQPPPPQPQPPPPLPPQTHIGDYGAIGSRSLPLLSAAHFSRLNTMQQHSTTSTPSPLPAGGSGNWGGSNGSANPPEPAAHQTDTASIRRRYMALERGM